MAVKVLIANGAHINIVKDDEYKILLKADADKDGSTPLYVAARNGHFDVVKVLLDKGANVKTTNRKGATSLYIAAQNGYVDIAKILIAKGAPIHTFNKRGFVALMIAAANGHIDVVKVLIEKYDDLSLIERYEAIPVALSLSAKNGHAQVVKLLIDNGADVNAVYPNGLTPLSVAARDGCTEVVRVLLENGADFNIQVNGKTALQVAKENYRDDVINYLQNFKKPLPTNIQLIPENYVLIRIWAPKDNGKTVSENKVFFKSLLGNPNVCPGHLSISIHDGNPGL